MVCACTVPFAAAAAAVLSLQPVSAVTEAAGGVPVNITVVLTTSTGVTLERDLVVTLQPEDGDKASTFLRIAFIRKCGSTSYVGFGPKCG